MIVVTDEAAKEALRLYVQGGSTPHEDMRKAIEAILPMLTDTGEPLAPRRDGLDGQYFSDRIDALAQIIQSAHTAAQGRQDAIYRRLDAITTQMRVLIETLLEVPPNTPDVPIATPHVPT